MLPQGVWEELNKVSAPKSSCTDNNDPAQFVSTELENTDDFSNDKKRKIGEIATLQDDKNEYRDDNFVQAFNSFGGKKGQGNVGQQRANFGKSMVGGRGMKRGDDSH